MRRDRAQRGTGDAILVDTPRHTYSANASVGALRSSLSPFHYPRYDFACLHGSGSDLLSCIPRSSGAQIPFEHDLLRRQWHILRRKYFKNRLLWDMPVVSRF